MGTTGMNDLIIIRNPFARQERDCIPLTGGTHTIQQLVDMHLHTAPTGVEFAASINGAVVPKDLWATTTVGSGDQLVVIPVVRGGGDGLGMILTIALMVVAPQLATSLYTSMGGTFVTSAAPWLIKGLEIGIGLIGSQVVGALTAPDKPSLPAVSQQSYDASPSYAWQPVTTQEPGAPVARAYGTVKLYGNIIAGFIETTGDTGREQTAHMLIDLGTGPYSALRDFKINDQAISLYEGVTVVTRMGKLNQDVIEAFNDTRRNHIIGSKVVKDSPVTRTTIGDDYDALEIVIDFPTGLRYSNDQGGLSAHSVNYTVEISDDAGATWRHVARTPRTVATTVATGYWSLGSWYHGIDDYTSTAQWYQNSTGSSVRTDHTDGETQTVGEYIYTWRWIDSTTTVYDTVEDYITTTAATQQSVRKVFRTDHLTRGIAYQVRVTNLSVDQTTSRYADDMYLAEINEVLYDDFQYPRTVLVAVKALATDQLSGGMRFSCIGDTALIRVWNGSAWSVVFNKNPAWVCWDVLTQPVFANDLTVLRYDGFDPSRLDLTWFYAWAQWCDELVPNATGGTEPRCEFDGIFDTFGTMWDMALEVAASARAMLFFRGTTVTGTHEHLRADPTQFFNVGNTLVNSFQEVFLPMADRASIVEYEFVNSTNDYERDKLTIVNPNVTENGAQRVQISNRGVKRPTQVWRDATFKLERNQLLRRSAELRVDIDALECTVGNLIWIQDDLTEWGVGGRATGGTTTTIDLDRSVELVVDTIYELRVRLADDTLLTRTITTGPGIVTSVTVSTPTPSAMGRDDLWAIGEVGRAVKEFLVVDVSRDGDQRALLSLIEYNPSLYDLDFGLPAVPTPDVSGMTPSITGITVREVLEHGTDGVVYVRLDVHFTLSNATGMKADLSADGGKTWSSQRRQSSGVVSWYSVVSGATYDIALTPTDYFDLPIGSWTYITHTVVGKLAPPADVTNFYMAVSGPNQALLTWDFAPDIDVQYGGNMEIRHSAKLTGAEWEGSQVIATPPGAASRENVSLLYGTYLAKWIDSSGKYSVNAAVIETDLASFMGLNAVATHADHPTWSGSKTNTVVDTGKLTLDTSGGDVLPAGTYAVPRIDLGDAYACYISADIPMTAYATGSTVDTRTGEIDEWTSIDGAVRDMVDVSLWVRSTVGDPSIPGLWGPFQPHPVGANLYGRAFDFELRLYSFATDQNVYVEECTITVDMEDRTETGVDVAYVSGTLGVTFSKPFFSVPAVSITAQSMAVGDFYTLTAKDETGFSIQFRNSGGADVARTFDWFATGF